MLFIVKSKNDKVQKYKKNKGKKIESVSCGVSNSLLLTSDGKIRPFGDFFSSLHENEFISLDEGYVKFITMLDDRFVFIRSLDPIPGKEDDWHEIKRKNFESSKKYVTMGVEASIPTPTDATRKSNFQTEKNSRGRESWKQIMERSSPASQDEASIDPKDSESRSLFGANKSTESDGNTPIEIMENGIDDDEPMEIKEEPVRNRTPKKRKRESNLNEEIQVRLAKKPKLEEKQRTPLPDIEEA